MKPYEKYKDSGVEWIGKVPEHWGICKIKHLAIGENTLFLDGDWIESKDIVFDSDNIRYITTGNIGEGKYKEQGSGYITEQTFQKLNCTEIYEGDLVISRLNPPIGRACLIPNLGKRIVTSVDNVILRPNENFNKGYLVFLFSNSNYFTQTSLMARGATMQRLSRGLLGEIAICTPPLPEQTAIARYLDQKTGEIDQLIAQKERLLALWEEEKTALINQAVTRGLDAGAKMKDSGVAWLGEVPEHWEVKRLKYVFELIKDKSELDLPKVGLENIESKTGNFIQSNTEFEGEGIDFKVNDILFGKLRPYLVKVYLAEFNGKAVGDFFVYRTKSRVLPAFGRYLMLSSNFIQIVNSSTFGSKMPRVSSEFLANLFISYTPSIPEQTAIVRHIETQTARIQTQMDQTRKLIELLKEYRATLISEVVTGKVKITE